MEDTGQGGWVNRFDAMKLNTKHQFLEKQNIPDTIN